MIAMFFMYVGDLGYAHIAFCYALSPFMDSGRIGYLTLSLLQGKRKSGVLTTNEKYVTLKKITIMSMLTCVLSHRIACHVELLFVWCCDH